MGTFGSARSAPVSTTSAVKYQVKEIDQNKINRAKIYCRDFNPTDGVFGTKKIYTYEFRSAIERCDSPANFGGKATAFLSLLLGSLYFCSWLIQLNRSNKYNGKIARTGISTLNGHISRNRSLYVKN